VYVTYHGELTPIHKIVNIIASACESVLAEDQSFSLLSIYATVLDPALPTLQRAVALSCGANIAITSPR
jgi:hypothetical protein